MRPHCPTLLTNQGVSEGRGPEVHAMTGGGRRCFQQSSGKVNGPPIAALPLRAHHGAGHRATGAAYGLTAMTTVRTSHRTRSLWAALGGSAWPAVDTIVPTITPGPR